MIKSDSLTELHELLLLLLKLFLFYLFINQFHININVQYGDKINIHGW